MDKKRCAQWGKYLKPDRRAVYCGRRCIWRAWHQRNIARSSEAQRLPLAVRPPDAEQILPAMGPQRLQVASRLALAGRAPVDAPWLPASPIAHTTVNTSTGLMPPPR